MSKTALKKAFQDAERSYSLACASVKASAEEVLASAPGAASGLLQSHDLSKAREQERHLTGWVAACIRVVAQKIAMQPIHVGRKKRVRTRKAVFEPIEDHPLVEMLANPNDLQTAFGLMFVSIASLQLTGRVVWWLPDGEEAIFPIPSSWIQRIEGGSRIAGIVIRPEGSAESIFLPREEIVYAAYPHPSGLKKTWSPLMAAGGAVDSDESIERSQVMTFRNGIFPRHAIIVGKDPAPGSGMPGMRPRLTAAQQRQITDAIKKRYSSTFHAGEPLILDGLIEDVKRLSNTPSEMDWLNSAKLTKNKICQIFGVNPIVLGEVEGANRASAVVADKHLIEFTVNPLIEMLSQSLTEYLGPMFDVDRVWIEPAVPNDSEMKLRWFTLLAAHGVIDADELREAAGLAPNPMMQLRLGPSASSVDNAISKLVDGRLASHLADDILESLDHGEPIHKQNGRS